MFKNYEILEDKGNSIKLKHVGTGDIGWRYKAICSVCSKDRGWKKAFQLEGKCKSCSQHDDFLSSLDKKNYPNVNTLDAQKHIKKTKGYEVRYRTLCLSCGRDRGYIPLSASNRPCRSCCRKAIHALKTDKDKRTIAQKISMTQTGHEVFSGFVTTELEKQRGIFKSLNLSKSCYERDNYTCQLCNIKGVHLNAHHKDGFDIYPDKRLELSNLITLCKTCHDKFHSEYGRGKNTEQQFIEFKGKIS